MDAVLFFGVAVIGLSLYFLPTIVAVMRGRQIGSVLVLNPFLGWTFVGWIVALVMAFSDHRPQNQQSVIVQQAQQAPMYPMGYGQIPPLAGYQNSQQPYLPQVQPPYPNADTQPR